jgi:putative intracellular protease/amidase
MSAPTHNCVLVVLTNTRELPTRGGREDISEEMAHRTGFDVKEVAYLYEHLYKHKKINLVFVTPKGGEAFIDPCSMEAARNDEIVNRFMKDHEAMDKIKNTKRIREVENQKFLGAVFPGGAGVLFDLPNEHAINEIVQEIYPRREGFIAAIGHGLAALLNVKTEKGELWLRGKRVTCQTLEEEKELKLERALPFMIEEKLKQIGAKFEKANKFQPHVVEDERLITAQNNYSTKEWVEAILRQCRMN